MEKDNAGYGLMRISIPLYKNGVLVETVEMPIIPMREDN